MKFSRSRRHLRPRPSRSQIHQQIARMQSAVQLFQLEWLLESQRPAPCHQRLRFLHDRIVSMREEMEELEAM